MANDIEDYRRELDQVERRVDNLEGRPVAPSLDAIRGAIRDLLDPAVKGLRDDLGKDIAAVKSDLTKQIDGLTTDLKKLPTEDRVVRLMFEQGVSSKRFNLTLGVTIALGFLNLAFALWKLTH